MLCHLRTSIHLPTGGVNTDHLVKVVPARFLHYKITALIFFI